MNWRHAALYWLAFAVLAVAYWLSGPTERFPEGPRSRPETEGTAWTDRVQSVVVESTRGQVRANRQAQEWRTEGGRVVTALVLALLEAVAEQEQREAISADPSDSELRAFGLSEPAVRLIFEFGSGEPPLRIQLGARNPAGTAVYARTDRSAAVFLWGMQPAYYAELLQEQDTRGTPSASGP